MTGAFIIILCYQKHLFNNKTVWGSTNQPLKFRLEVFFFKLRNDLVDQLHLNGLTVFFPTKNFSCELGELWFMQPAASV